MSKDSKKQFLQRLKFLKLKDILCIFPMIVGLFLSVFLHFRRKKIWLVCERRSEARDNGYWFFKYLCENHKEICSVYAINKKAIDYQKVKNLGKVISFGGVVHWAYYFAAKYNISSQKEGKPNAALCFLLEVYLGARKNRIYLKHGIIKDAQRWIYYDVSKIRLMCCAAKREYEYIKNTFGYREENVVLTGLCRFDNLLTPHGVKRQVLIMPTMREWLRTISSDTLKYENTNDFCKSEYFITWKSLIENQRLIRLLEDTNTDLLFYPHPAMQKYLASFETKSSHIIIASSKIYDMQTLLMESSLLITDYSSIFFDFAYMLKPLIYYQFDYEKYRKGQYQEGYFSYQEDGFGPVVKTEIDLLDKVEEAVRRNFEMETLYLDRSKSFYAYHDTNNCERTFFEIQKLNGKC